MVKWIMFFIAVGLINCKPADKPHITAKPISGATIKKTTSQTEVELDYLEQDKKDAVQLSTMLRDMLRIAYGQGVTNAYHKKISRWNYVCETTGDIKFGHLFDRSKKHLIIKRNMGTWLTYVDVFILKKFKFCLVLSIVKADRTMIADTTRDINGDHFKDFVVHWYPSSGCCRRNIYDVYLYQQRSGRFTRKYEFVNPTFSPSEKIIRGLEYSQPGEGPLYKYKWNSFHVDTMAFIYPKDTLARGLPDEFRKIEDIDWFTDKSLGELSKTGKAKGG